MPADCDPRISIRDDFDSFKLQRVDDTVIPMQRSEHLEWEGKKRFPSRELNAATILERWGKGYYIASLFATVGSGKTYRGLCRAFVVDDEGGVRRLTPASKRSPQNDEGTAEDQPHAPPVETRVHVPLIASPAVASPPGAPAPIVPPPIGGDPMQLFMWMTQVQRDAQAGAERLLEREYARMRADSEERVARERQNSALLLQQAQQFYEAMTRVNKRPDPEAGALAKIESRLEEIQDQLDGDAEEEEQQEKAQQSDLAVAITSAKEMIAPVMPMLMEKLMNGASSAVVK